MGSFDYFREGHHKFRPKTSHAALRAVVSHILPAEAYIYSATSVRPLDEEPYDIDQIERVLGRENLDIESNLLLIKILERLLRSPEQEVALFAAESVNLIEERYAKKIERLKEAIEGEPDPEKIRDLSDRYAELARLYPPGSSLRGFYLHESYLRLESLRATTTLTLDDTIHLIRVLIDLGLYDQAAEEFARIPPHDDVRLLFLKAEIEFQRHNYSQVLQACREIQSTGALLPEKERSLLDHWLELDGA